MEIEMKLRIPDNQCAARIWEDEFIQGISEDNSRETIQMKAVYFDTEDRSLLARDIAFRVRAEGTKVIASLKWNGSSVDGLHRREEINVPVREEACLISPSAELFRESEPGKRVMEIVGDRPLHNILEIHSLRRRVRVDTGRSISEIAVDTGEIIGDRGTLPICELEVELYSGDEKDMEQVAANLAEKYGLVPEDRSKFARGLSLIQETAK